MPKFEFSISFTRIFMKCAYNVKKNAKFGDFWTIIISRLLIEFWYVILLGGQEPYSIWQIFESQNVYVHFFLLKAISIDLT